MVTQGLGVEENGELEFNRYKISIWDDEKVLEMDGGNSCRTVCMALPLNCMLTNGYNGKFYFCIFYDTEK